MKSQYKIIAILGGVFFVHSLLHGQITLHTVTDPQLAGVKPTNITSGQNGETLVLKGNKIYTYTNQVDDVYICDICADIQDVAFVGDTMYIANGQQGIVKRFGDSTLQVSPLRTTRIVSDGAGNLYAIENLDGIVVWNGSQWTHMTTSNSTIPTNDIYDLAIDNAGVLWMGTLKGLISWNGTTFSTKSVPNDLSAAFYDIEIDSSDNKWVASAFGGVGKYSGMQWTTFPETFGELERVENLATLSGSEIWTSEGGYGLFRNTGSGFILIPFADLGVADWQNNSVLFGDSQNRLWIANAFTELKYLTVSPSAVSDFKQEIKTIQTYPNPAYDEVFLSIDSNFLTGKMYSRIYNSDGVLVRSQKFMGGLIPSVSLLNLASGVYEIVVSSEHGELFKGRFTKVVY
ncbi:MAG: T9SS type A sorting domain-containing protein [Saprospiraceae bacterium]